MNGCVRSTQCIVALHSASHFVLRLNLEADAEIRTTRSRLGAQPTQRPMLVFELNAGKVIAKW